MTLVVINPAIRMSWILKHWDNEFIENAATTIKELASLFLCFYLLRVNQIYLKDG
jgi:hypothetical protein